VTWPGCFRRARSTRLWGPLDATPLGAVEGLARLAREDAEARLVQIGKAEKEDEELRKAAWRGLRRSKRARKKQAQAPIMPKGAS
jgi:hypothetical protein